MTSILSLLPKPEPDVDIIKRLEEVLEDAKIGRVSGFLLLTQSNVGDLGYYLAGITNRLTVLGFLSRAMYKLQSDD